MKKLLPLIASMILLASCGGTTPASSSASAQPSGPGTSQTTPAKTAKLSFLEAGELYLDFNFESAPEGFSIKVGETTLSSSGKVKMTKDFTYEVNGTFTAPMNIYRVVETNTAAINIGKAEGRDAETLKDYIERNLASFSKNLYEDRIYLCFSDKASGWSKTLAGVNDALAGAE